MKAQSSQPVSETGAQHSLIDERDEPLKKKSILRPERDDECPYTHVPDDVPIEEEANPFERQDEAVEADEDMFAQEEL